MYLTLESQTHADYLSDQVKTKEKKTMPFWP